MSWRILNSGRLKDGERLPSEIELVEQFATSRPTVARALRDLQNLGLVERKVGSGTYVRRSQKPADSWRFGLLIPGLGSTEIFEPICGQLARSGPEAAPYASVGRFWRQARSGGSGIDRTGLHELHPADGGRSVFCTSGIDRRQGSDQSIRHCRVGSCRDSHCLAGPGYCGVSRSGVVSTSLASTIGALVFL